MAGFEPTTSRLLSECSTAKLHRHLDIWDSTISGLTGGILIRHGDRFELGFLRVHVFASFVGLVVMTLALHARGPQFTPGTKY